MHRTAALLLLLGLAPHTARALPLISEVLYDAVGSDDGSTFVELYGVPGTSLEGLSLVGVNGANGNIGPVVALTGSIPADGFFVIADDRGDGQSQVAEADLVPNFDFQNGPDSIALRLGDTVLDAVGYGAFGSGEVFAGEGAPAPDTPAGWSLARRFADVDTGDNSADFELRSVPTPGSGPLAAPEPATALLVAAGLAGLARLGRPRPPVG